MIQFIFKPSRTYQFLLVVVYAASMLVIALLAMPLMGKLPLLLALTAYMTWVFWHYGLLKAPLSIQCLRHVSDRQWVVVTRDNEVEAEICGDSTVTRWVSVLRFRVGGRKRPISCIVFNDSLAQDQYRKLMVAVR